MSLRSLVPEKSRGRLSRATDENDKWILERNTLKCRGQISRDRRIWNVCPSIAFVFSIQFVRLKEPTEKWEGIHLAKGKLLFHRLLKENWLKLLKEEPRKRGRNKGRQWVKWTGSSCHWLETRVVLDQQLNLIWLLKLFSFCQFTLLYNGMEWEKSLP